MPETLIDHPLLSNTFWGEGEGLSTSGVLRPVLDLNAVPRSKHKEKREQKQMKRKKKHFVIIYEKEGKEEEERKKEKKKEWNEIGDR